MHLPWEEDAQSHHQHLFEENVGKTGKGCGLQTLSVKGSAVVFTHGEGISTPHTLHKGRQPLIKCSNMTSNYFLFFFIYHILSIEYLLILLITNFYRKTCSDYLYYFLLTTFFPIYNILKSETLNCFIIFFYFWFIYVVDY